MPFKPNYRMQRADRARSKAEKQQKKLERRAARTAEREAQDNPLEPNAIVPGGDHEPQKLSTAVEESANGKMVKG